MCRDGREEVAPDRGGARQGGALFNAHGDRRSGLGLGAGDVDEKDDNTR